MIAVFFACAQPMELYGQCSSNGCPLDGSNAQPEGSICNAKGICQCPMGTHKCCPKGPPGVCQHDVCPEEDECPNLGPGDGGTPIAECSDDSDCPQPKSKQCGAGSCVEGKCALVIHVGPIASQLYGDCLRRECDAAGALIELEDTTDYYDDGNECTFDFCKDKAADKLILPDGTPCPDKTEGYCLQAACVECIDWMPGANCGMPTLYCDYSWCVPMAQCQVSSCGGLCAPCAAGSGCTEHSDCESNVCKGSMCVLGTCNDGTKNNTETGVDCGGPCPTCPDGEGCAFPSDCKSQVCKQGFCQPPTCTDAKQNGDEAGIDCGLSACDAVCP